MSCCRWAADFEINLKSSAYASGMVRVTTLHRSFTYLIKNRGPSIDPCGDSGLHIFGIGIHVIFYTPFAELINVML